ncbi:hypothetical protein TSTA_115800 [Talaromyces stipitatus ATCC 10500]|uniref:Uncharacterized protein n=1 Tax=Talaromyces stipitatus (strain ATCC 10500 / CBS 375.48 / QM 6759 / NRRL 1006) TaxID=441959 RepID=B8MAU6_TALSN|nr:uncharacterized protein TSTA_115800 [Talaromyces stipitatus ATCC 10500]EED17787.1 hypothetical protein TSTA_115800 [Talaromyces stipitatus ATCC 10500]
MPEGRRVLILRIPSEKLALTQPMDGVKKHIKRVGWKADEKEKLLFLRDQHPKMPIKEFQQKMRKEAGEDGDDAMTQPSRPQKRTAFVFSSESEDEDSSSDERIEDINPSGHRTPNKFVKLSHNTGAQSPSVRPDIEQRVPIIRPQTSEAPQTLGEATTAPSRPKSTPPETTAVVQDTKSLESRPDSRPESTDKNAILPASQLAKCSGTEIQCVFNQDMQQLQARLENQKQYVLPEAVSRQKFARRITAGYEILQALCHIEEDLSSETSQLRAQNSVLQREYEMMKTEKDLEISRLQEEVKSISRLQEEAKSLQAERDRLIDENIRLRRKVELMKDLVDS